MGKAKTEKGKDKRPKGKPDDIPSTAAALRLEILTLEEAAALLRVSVDGLRADAEKGTVPARNVGGEWRFFTQALHAWLTQPHFQPKRLHSSDLGPPVGMERITKSMPGRRMLADIPMPDITPEEYEAFRAELATSRDEVDRVTKSGKYAEGE